MPDAPDQPKFNEACSINRKAIKELAVKVHELHQFNQFLIYEDPKPDFAEMHANITLCYRHLEDAAMRLGKAIQAFDGGKSVYDK
jgi:hypothetical protein